MNILIWNEIKDEFRYDTKFSVLNNRQWYQFSCSVMSDSLRPHGLQHTGFPVYHQIPELTQTHVHQVSDAIQPSHPLFFLCPPASVLSRHQGLLSQFFSSGGQSTGVSASASVLPVNIQEWFLLGWNRWISLLSKELSRIFSNTTVQKHQFFGAQLSFCPTLISIHDYWKNHSFD